MGAAPERLGASDAVQPAEGSCLTTASPEQSGPPSPAGEAHPLLTLVFLNTSLDTCSLWAPPSPELLTDRHSLKTAFNSTNETHLPL